MKTLAQLLLPLLLLGCESRDADRVPASDPGLLAVAKQEAVYLGKIFSLPYPDWDLLSIRWGELSYTYRLPDYDAIYIDKTVAEYNDDVLHAHIRDEIFHVMSGLWHETEYCNGVRIADYVLTW